MRHRLDPQHLHVLAETLGAIGAVAPFRFGEATAELCAAIDRMPAIAIVNRFGLRARLHHSMYDAEENARLHRSEAERGVRGAVALAVAGKKSSVIVKAVAEGARGCLTIAEAHAIALDQAFRELPK